MSKHRNNCWQVTGPPGTGKTFWLVRQAKNAISVYGPEKIVCATLTRAAAFEFSNRGLSLIPEKQIGTLHSLCRKALDGPELAETEEGKEAWNASLGGNHGAWALNTERSGPQGFDETRTYGEGDKFLARYAVIRATGEEPDRRFWNASFRAFVNRWEEWKASLDLMDFTDLIENALHNTTTAPGEPAVLLGDEAQDWSKLEVNLFRDHWGQHAEKVVLVGDPDQSIYAWRGADPRIFLDHPVPENQKILLGQSYRVPRAVRNCALAWISSQIRDREAVEYEPRPEDGSVALSGAFYRSPEILRETIEAIQASDESLMILASCNFMLRPILGLLREWGIPFDNKHRTENGAWNPLRRGAVLKAGRKGKPTTRLDRIIAFQAVNEQLLPGHSHEWTWEQIHHWTAPLRSTGKNPALARGAKKQLEELAANGDQSAGAFTDAEFGALWAGGWDGPHARMAHQANLEWWLSAMREKEIPGYRYLVRIFKERGARALLDAPRIHPGTIHSVKGGEADHVILFPDLSPAAAKEHTTLQGQEATARLFYVGMTRARKRLILCQPSNQNHVDFNYCV